MNVYSAILNLLTKIARSVPLKLGYIICECTGRLFYFLLSSLRKRVVRDIYNAYSSRGYYLPISTCKNIVCNVFITQMKNIYEILKLSNECARKLVSNINVYGLENLENALHKKKGVILLLCHFGNWELLGAYLGLNGFKVSTFYMDQYIKELTYYLNNMRKQFNLNLINRNKPYSALSVLKNGGILAMISDQDGGEKGVYLEFFGRLVSAMPGPAAFSYKTHASLLPARIYRNNDNSHSILFDKPLSLFNIKNKKEFISNNTKLIYNYFENIILSNPREWLWFYNRYKRRRHMDRHLGKIFLEKQKRE